MLDAAFPSLSIHGTKRYNVLRESASRTSRSESRELSFSEPFLSSSQRHRRLFALSLEQREVFFFFFSSFSSHLGPDACVLGRQLQLCLPGVSAGGGSRVGGSHFLF